MKYRTIGVRIFMIISYSKYNNIFIGILQCGKHKCPNPPFACDLSTSNKNKRKAIETIATCTGRDKKIRKFKDTSRNLRRLNVDINIQTSGSIDDIKINIEGGADTTTDTPITEIDADYHGSWGMPMQRKPTRVN